jgi:hypothetical protein
MTISQNEPERLVCLQVSPGFRPQVSQRRKVKVFLGVVVVVTLLTSCARRDAEPGASLVLPNHQLIGCISAHCQDLWEPGAPRLDASYPVSISLDVRHGCPFGLVARFDETVSLEAIKSAIDQRYSKWALPDNNNAATPVKLWRIEPEKFAIQLAVVEESNENMTLGQSLAQPLPTVGKTKVRASGPKQVIYYDVRKFGVSKRVGGWLIPFRLLPAICRQTRRNVCRFRF